MAERMGANHYGEERRETGQGKAEAIIEVELRRVRLCEAGLAERTKNDPRKIKLAARLRQETVMPVSWIARRLSLGSRNCATKLLYAERRQRKEHRSDCQS